MAGRRREILDRTYDPVRQVLDKDNRPLRVQVPFSSPLSRASVARGIGQGFRFILLDTDVEGKSTLGPDLTPASLHQRPEQRLRQNRIGAIGGMRVLEAFGHPSRGCCAY